MANTYVALENYIKNFIKKEKLSIEVIDKLNIYILDKNLNHKQIWFSFKLSYDKYLNVVITYFTSYTKQNDKHLRLSPIGHIDKIITYLIHYELKNYLAINSYKEFVINLALDLNIPSIDNGFIIKIDKRSSTADIKCPICILNYRQFELEKTTLPCGHAICKTCLLKLFKSNMKTCPLCRKNILEELDESHI